MIYIIEVYCRSEGSTQQTNWNLTVLHLTRICRIWKKFHKNKNLKMFEIIITVILLPLLALLYSHSHLLLEWNYYVHNPIDFIFPFQPHHSINWTSSTPPFTQHSSSTSRTKDNLPNVILILADDLGYNDISFYNSHVHKLVSTPNIDSIGKLGASFTNSYSGVY